MNGKFKVILACVLVAALSFGCGFAGSMTANYISKSNQGNTTNSEVATQIAQINEYIEQSKANAQKTSGNTSSSGSVSISDITDEEFTQAIGSVGEKLAEAVMPSVVSVTTTYEYTTSTTDIYQYFFGYGGGGKTYTQEASCVGTGFIVDESGYLLTNSHVVNDGDYKKITINLYDGRECEGTVLWSDSTLDLAVVKIEADNLTAATLGDSDSLKIGSYAAAIGNPLGLTFQWSMSAGIISGLDRTITVSDSSGTSTTYTTMEGLIQTDAAINSGNSGGPLLNIKGEVIGIASARASSGENMGFAIPINTAKPIIEQIVKTGTFERVYIGITGIGIESQTSLSSEMLKEYYGATEGIYVASVSSGAGADKAGLQKGDVITKLNGTEVGTMNKMYSILISYKSGETIKVTYLRDGVEHTVDVTLMTYSEMEAAAGNSTTQQQTTPQTQPNNKK